jgi:predicted DNA-binding transcriptional regulator AlpA
MTKKIENESLIPAALAVFDLMPYSARVRLPVVCGLFACSPATVWRRCKTGELPAPTKVRGCTSWNVGEIRAALGITSQSCMKDAA